MPPWDLYQQPSYWRDLALEAAHAESKATDAAMKRARRKAT